MENCIHCNSPDIVFIGQYCTKIEDTLYNRLGNIFHCKTCSAFQHYPTRSKTIQAVPGIPRRSLYIDIIYILNNDRDTLLMQEALLKEL